MPGWRGPAGGGHLKTMKRKAGKTPAAPRRVAFFASERAEYAARVLEGLLRFQSDHAGFVLRDFQEDVTLNARGRELTAQEPPWASWRPDGLVAILQHDPEAVPWVRRGGHPVVCIGSDFCGLLPVVHIAYDSIAELAMNHFLELGYDHFGLVGVG